ncbi:MAG: Asp-tRNA(Asn)/Glu-tRNA(Gln) amidotransferase subunit GatB [Patescibacteria group bacterium]|nr:Asp-tRNA(Asn)/Glu-tRNA(Gln) amidotransferase subunit GatB [Patescibacteria group bacterium]
MSKHELEPVIGLEVHIELKTKSKLFCSCEVCFEKRKPNTNICPICFGMVGTLPVMNRKAFNFALITALSIGCEIPKRCKWDRKSYFYPDLPKGYQISQFDEPLSRNGYIEILSNNKFKGIRINRLHLEEDAGKLIHNKKLNLTMVDLNRAGIPLIEIVTEPDISNPEEAKLLLKDLRRTVRYLNVADADMEKGEMRCDASVSLRPKGEKKLYPRTEIKNLNSFRAVEKALFFEIEKQKKYWKKNGPPSQESTVLWDENTGETLYMRDKESGGDYRYFPEPDLPEIELEEKFIEEMRSLIPEMPIEKIKKYHKLGIADKDIFIIVEDVKLAQFFDKCLEFSKKDRIKTLTNLFSTELMYYLKKKRLDEIHLTPEDIILLVNAIEDRNITKIMAKSLLKKSIENNKDIKKLLKQAKTEKNEFDAEYIVQKIISENPKPAEDYKSGKEMAINVILGKIIQETKGKIDAKDILEIIKKNL